MIDVAQTLLRLQPSIRVLERNLPKRDPDLR